MENDVLGRRSRVDLLWECVDLLSQFFKLAVLGTGVSTCPGGGVDTLSKIWKMLFWEEGPVSTCSGSVSTCCPNSSNWLFWELGLVSTCSESVSTW
ncbi:hypothetical protein Taro_036020, partial [Colocasia esculenta]|nr:hypothetical protein [Colocasia esculenta]